MLSSSSLKLILSASILTLVILACFALHMTEAKAASSTKQKKQQQQASSKTKSSSSSEEIELPSESGSSPSSSNKKTTASSSTTKKNEESNNNEDVLGSSSSSSSSNTAPLFSGTITIRGQLSNITRLGRDARSGQPIRVHPRDVAQISVNGNERVFYTDIGGSFALVLNIPAKGLYAGNSRFNANPTTYKDRVALYQIDIDWDKLMFPRVLVEVDEFGNYRAYQDGSGKIVGSKGRMGIDKNNKNKNKEPTAAMAENSDEEDSNNFFDNNNEDDDASFNSGGNRQLEILQVEAVGEVEYFVPRQQFRIWDLFKNPMIIMMIVTAGMVYVMPQLVDQDEMKKQMRDLQGMKDDATGGATAAVEGGKKKAVKQ